MRWRLIHPFCILLVLVTIISAEKLQRRSKCSNVYKRREWRMLSQAEKDKYFAATKQLFDSPSLLGLKNFHSDLVKTHADVGSETHMTNFFLPWHRYFVYMFEQRLRKIDPDVTLPYFDWTMDGQNITHSTAWQDFGGGGDERMKDGPKKGCIYKGPYAYIQPELPEPDCIKRQQEPGVFPAVDLYAHLTLAHDDYESFRERMEIAHNNVHANIGGTYPGSMAFFYSPNDPLFYVHHAQIDRLWSQWQDRHPNSDHYPFPDTIINFNALNLDGKYVTVKEILNIKDDLCYEYANSVIPVYDDSIEDNYSHPYSSLQHSDVDKSHFLTTLHPLPAYHKFINLQAFSPSRAHSTSQQNHFLRRDWSLASPRRRPAEILRSSSNRNSNHRPSNHRFPGLTSYEGIERIPSLEYSGEDIPSDPPAADPHSSPMDTHIDGEHHDPTKIRSLRPNPDSWKWLGKYDIPFVTEVYSEYDRYYTYVNSIPTYESICSLHNLMRAQSYRERTDEEEKKLWDTFKLIETGYQEAVRKAQKKNEASGENQKKSPEKHHDSKEPGYVV